MNQDHQEDQLHHFGEGRHTDVISIVKMRRAATMQTTSFMMMVMVMSDEDEGEDNADD